jgi:UDPglucose 6-dehydrogenase
LKIAVFGLGKLGLPLAALLANSGNSVIGVDISEDFIKSLVHKDFNFSEPNLNDELHRSVKSLQFTSDYEFAVNNSDIAFVIVPTPSLDDGSFSNENILNVISSMSTFLKDPNKKYIINIVSTVMPGTCENQLIPLLELKTSRKVSVNFGITYNPEFIALGSVIHNMKNPDMLLIGTKFLPQGVIINELLSSFTIKKVPNQTMSLTEAELVKISINNFITMKIQFANQLLRIVENHSGLDIDTITQSIGLDSRIGQKYLKAGTPFGGPCFPRDTRAMTKILASSGVNFPLSDAVELGNTEFLEYLVNKLFTQTSSYKTVGILGLSYKSNTDVLDESPGIELALKLANLGRNVICWDPNIKNINLDGLEYIEEYENFLANSEIIVITRPIEDLKDSQKRMLSKMNIIDLWRTKNEY